MRTVRVNGKYYIDYRLYNNAVYFGFHTGDISCRATDVFTIEGGQGANHVSREILILPGSRPKYSSTGAAMVMSHISLERY